MLARLVLRRQDCEAHLLRNRSADEAPDAVILPIRGFGDFSQSRSLFPAQEFKNERLLRAGSFARRVRFPFSGIPFLNLLRSDTLVGRSVISALCTNVQLFEAARRVDLHRNFAPGAVLGCVGRQVADDFERIPT